MVRDFRAPERSKKRRRSSESPPVGGGEEEADSPRWKIRGNSGKGKTPTIRLEDLTTQLTTPAVQPQAMAIEDVPFMYLYIYIYIFMGLSLRTWRTGGGGSGPQQRAPSQPLSPELTSSSSRNALKWPRASKALRKNMHHHIPVHINIWKRDGPV